MATANSFGEICLAHLDTVFRVARRLARDDAEAEDLVQETFLKAFHSFERFELRDHGAKPWLFRILHNTFYTRRDRDRRQPASLDDASVDRLSAESTDTDADGRPGEIRWDAIDGELKRAIEDLHPEYRVVLLLWALEGMSYKQIAEVCGCPTGTVMSRLHRARRTLLASLGDPVVGEHVKRKA